MKYNTINTISNYLSYINSEADKIKYNYEKNKNIINEIILNGNEQSMLYLNLQQITSNNILEMRDENNLRLCVDYSTLIFCKFAKESIFECLRGENTKFYNYNIGTNQYKPYKVIDEISKLGLKITKTEYIYEANSNKEIHGGMHFFLGLNDKILLENYNKFGEKIVLGISDPQILDLPNFKIYHDTDLIFNNIFVNNIFSSSNPIVIKELLQEMSIDNKQFDRFIGMSGNISLFDKLIKQFKKIEFAETNINILKQFDDLQTLNAFINIKSNNIHPIKYKETIDFLEQAKNIYLILKEDKIFDLNLFCQKLDDICPGKLNIFDEKYQIEQFRDTYRGKEFKEKFLNNLAKTGNELTDTEIKKLFMPLNIINKIINKLPHRIQLNEDICNKILDYNKNNQTKQIPILLLIKDLKELDNIKLKQLNEIIDKYISGKTEYLYDYIVRQDELDNVINKMNPSLDKIIINNTVDNKLNKIKDIEEIR